MLYLLHTTISQPVRIPVSVDKPSGDVSLKLRSTVNLSDEVDTTVILLSLLDRYYSLAVTLPEDAPAGEYEYTLAVGDTVLSTGLAIVGDFIRNTTQYNKSIEYEQYDTTE